jgi:hypothetical protein
LKDLTHQLPIFGIVVDDQDFFWGGHVGLFGRTLRHGLWNVKQFLTKDIGDGRNRASHALLPD